MRRAILLSAVLFLLQIVTFVPVRGQSIEEDFRKKVNINILYSELISRYQQSEMWDSINVTLKLWRKQCGDIEPVVRCKILRAIQMRRFSEDILPENIIDYLYAFSARNSISGYSDKFTVERKKDKDCWVLDSYVAHNFNKVTKDWADQLSKDTTLSDLEMAFCGFYAHRYDDLAFPLSTGAFRGTELGCMWDERKTGWEKTGGAEMSIMYSFGDRSLVMPRISAGYYLGASYKIISVNTSIQLSLALPLHEITARNGLGELTTGKNFSE